AVMNKHKIDRRGVACALTFGLKAPYVMLPLGFGLLFHNIIRDALIDNGLEVVTGDIWKSMLLPGIGMIVGLLIAVFITYRKPREYKTIDSDLEIAATKTNNDSMINRKEIGALIGAIVAFVIQIKTDSLPLGATAGLLIMLLFGSFKFNELDEIINGGVELMGFIAFVMLVASG